MKVSLERMALCCLAVLVIFVSTIRVDGQTDSNGFISIDCGLGANSSIVDSQTKLTYVSDDQFIDTGVNYKIATEHANDLFEQFLTVRSFPNGTRNCYTLRSLTVGSKYLVRAIFVYGNYDNLNEPPIFDIYLGVNHWMTMNISTADDVFLTEIIATATADYLQVCLVNTDDGTPFISWLDLRPLKTSLYRYVNATQSLVYLDRLNLGASDSPTVRYPEDPYDRIWRYHKLGTSKEISTSSTIQPDVDYATPSIVMQTAATTLSTNQSLDLLWTSEYSSTVYLVILHIREIQNIPSTDLREFDIFTNGEPLFSSSTKPDKLYSAGVSYTYEGDYEYNVSLQATSNSTLPPLLNAMEVYIIAPLSEVPTHRGDVTAMNKIKASYHVEKDWSGDPCVPTSLSWNDVYCASDSKDIPRITELDLSSSGLTGVIISSFGDLTALESLDLSDNNLSGALPTSLDQLTALTYLDITENYNISTTLPPGLKKKHQDGVLTFKFEDGSATPSRDSTQSRMKKKSPAAQIAVAVVAVLIVVAASIIVLLYLKRQQHNQISIPKPHESYGSSPLANVEISKLKSEVTEDPRKN